VSESYAPQPFATTRWSVVVAARASDPGRARPALEALCRAYWMPLYADARRRGAARHHAEDLVQGFFAEFLEKGWAADADRERGRFRTFLRTAFRRYDADEHERGQARKRGGGVATLRLDFDEGEMRFRAEGSRELEPDRAFERRWALTLLARALDRARREAQDAGRGEAFEALVPWIGGAGVARPYAEIAQALGSTEGAIKVAVHRLRARYREHLRDEIRDTVRDEAAVDDEIRHLMASV